MSCDVEDACVCRSDKLCGDATCSTCPYCSQMVDVSQDEAEDRYPDDIVLDLDE